MTFGIIPGLCLVAYMFECGNERKAFKISGIISFWKEVIWAKKEGIKETAKLFFPWHPTLGAFFIIGILFIIFGDSLMLIVVNVTAIPVSLFSYFQGIKMRDARGVISFESQDPEFDDKIFLAFKAVFPYSVRIILIWILLSAIILGIADVLDFWKPH